MDFSLGYHVFFFTFSVCNSVFKKTPKQAQQQFYKPSKSSFLPFSSASGIWQERWARLALLYISSLSFSPLTPVAVVQIRHSGMCTGKIHLEPCYLYREVGPGLNLFSVNILSVFTCLSQVLRLRVSLLKKPKHLLLYFYEVCSVL